MISENKVQQVFDWLQTFEEPMAESKAKVYLLEQQLKSVKADLMMGSMLSSNSAQETYALAHKNYKAHVMNIYEEMRIYEKFKLKRDTGMAILDSWRTQEASKRILGNFR